MRIAGQILLWIGFGIGSLATVFNSSEKGVNFVKSLNAGSEEVVGFEWHDVSSVEIPQEGWNLIPWGWYGLGVGLCLLGAVITRILANEKLEKQADSNLNLTELESALSRAVTNVQKLSKVVLSQAPSKTVKSIDLTIAEDLRKFAESREIIVSEYDLTVFADVMTQFAAGERAINRAWSAAADGYIDEAADCIKRGHQLLAEALKLLSQAPKTTSH